MDVNTVTSWLIAISLLLATWTFGWVLWNVGKMLWAADTRAGALPKGRGWRPREEKRKVRGNPHPVLWSIEDDGPWKGTPEQEWLYSSRIPPQSRFAGFKQMRNERWDATTPVPHPHDRVSCACGNLFRRYDDADYHRTTDGGICGGPITVTYVNPPYFPPHMMPPPPPKPTNPSAQGATRGGHA
jgi:hypothetical protein